MKLSTRWIGWRVSPFFAASVVAHLALFILIATTDAGRGCQPVTALDVGPGFAARHTGPIDVTMIEPTVLNPFASRPTPAEEQAEIEKKQEEARRAEEDPSMSGQVVDIARPDIEIRPDEANYLAEFDSKVEKESKSRPGEGKAGAREPRKQQAASSPPPSEARPPAQAVQPVAPRAPSAGSGGAGGKGALAMRSRTTTPSETRGKEDGLEH
jgi:hypothetical protein